MTKEQANNEKTLSQGGMNRFIAVGGIFIILIALLIVGSLAGLVEVDWEGLLNSELAEIAPTTSPNANSNPAVINTEPLELKLAGGWYQVYFTSPRFPDDETTNRDRSVPDGLIQAINSARSTLDIAIYELDLEDVGDAILAAQDRGVRVRLVTDSDELETLETLIRLEKEGIPIVPDNRKPIMHNKFAVIDGQAVWTGSWNFTPNGTFRNNNNAILIKSRELAQNYSTEFEEMFIAKTFGLQSASNTPNPKLQIDDTLIETCFAPEDECAIKLAGLLSEAQTNIRFMAFSFTHDIIGKVVRDRARAGVDVKGVFETRGSDTEASEYSAMRRQGIDVLPDGNPYTLHHKVFIIDDQIVVLGSFNFSENADESNDENMLVIHNSDIAQAYLAEFNRNYTQALNQE